MQTYAGRAFSERVRMAREGMYERGAHRQLPLYEKDTKDAVQHPSLRMWMQTAERIAAK